MCDADVLGILSNCSLSSTFETFDVGSGCYWLPGRGISESSRGSKHFTNVYFQNNCADGDDIKYIASLMH